MFSIMTMASSTTKPAAMVSAISDRLLRLKPHRYITAKVPISDSGTDRLGMIVAGTLRRNRKITSTTSATATAVRVEQRRRFDARTPAQHNRQAPPRPRGPLFCAWCDAVVVLIL